ncbi:MAG: Glycosyl transferase group 1 [Candidatus Roizmanbacteria bacterium GW2011_GWA2_36_23]|uniref:Glycosyl transferase group 1 n=1 Tax=Candidatus Roizmanbacteria bacterium GW2011_GWA2_36_23 TaxID=1618480 RepID=A0A0G0E5I4_9BACT|nr:MAG: Glycosyl transferase group 1 [Candidatus Roizmanbacteria bacterium GW2011_GWA2_36_23]
MFKASKIAIVYDWIDKWGGVERLLLNLHQLFPQADFLTSYYNDVSAPWAKQLHIKTSFIQNLPPIIKNRRLMSFPFYPFAFEQLDLSDYDIVISVSSSFAKSVITKPGTLHLGFLLTPMRFLWLFQEDYIRSRKTRLILQPYLSYLKQWDYVAGQRPDRIISISETIADRCKKIYNRSSEVLYPPFDTGYWQKIKHQLSKTENNFKDKFRMINNNYYLVVSRLEPYKKTEIIIEAFNNLKENLLVIGTGSEENKLKKMAKSNILFINSLSDQELAYFYTHARALIMSQEEDFGYVSLEAQYFGCPVIAYKKGGAAETVVNGKTGLFFDKQHRSSFMDTLERFHIISYNLKEECQKYGQDNVNRFEKRKFNQRLYAIIREEVNR